MDICLFRFETEMKNWFAFNRKIRKVLVTLIFYRENIVYALQCFTFSSILSSFFNSYCRISQSLSTRHQFVSLKLCMSRVREITILHFTITSSEWLLWLRLPLIAISLSPFFISFCCFLTQMRVHTKQALYNPGFVYSNSIKKNACTWMICMFIA